MGEATDLEVKADKVVQAIVAKGPELVLEVHKRLQLEVQKTAFPWHMSVHRTQVAKFALIRFASDGVTVAARVEMKSRWSWSTPNTQPLVKGVGDNVWDAMRQADQNLRLSGVVPMPGFPTATPWKKTTHHGADLWVRVEQDGAPKSELVRVGQELEEKGSNWYWLITKLGGPGPTEPQGPWGTKKLAMKEADEALRNVGWKTP
jgi:hypothetical protein